MLWYRWRICEQHRPIDAEYSLIDFWWSDSFTSWFRIVMMWKRDESTYESDPAWSWLMPRSDSAYLVLLIINTKNPMLPPPQVLHSKIEHLTQHLICSLEDVSATIYVCHWLSEQDWECFRVVVVDLEIELLKGAQLSCSLLRKVRHLFRARGAYNIGGPALKRGPRLTHFRIPGCSRPVTT